MRTRFMTKLIIFFALVMASMVPLMAQEDGGTVTDDDVNDVAGKLYCPVCENIPLDACGTAACEDWRYEIRLQLEDGLSEQEIIDDFVVRFGDRVVGTPQDPVLRVISLVVPWVLIGLGLFFGVRYFFLRNRHSSDTDIADSLETSSPKKSSDDYYDLLEKDIGG